MSMSGAGVLERQQQYKTSIAHWGRTSLPSLVRSLQGRRQELRRQASVGTPPRCRRLRHSRHRQRGSGIDTRSPATKLGCAQSSIASRPSDKVLTRCLPHVSTDSMRYLRLSICLLLRPHRSEFLEDVSTGDESWTLTSTAQSGSRE
ncbi:hypothetical protein V3C99_015940 [Haemonchus contortus]|uniref:Uncharacterized protein n=1 Tax=Haemonchus contortus TaxID=6289 RepID=A0A7I4YX97_HAECO